MEPAFDLIGAMVRQPKLESASITSLRTAEGDRVVAAVKDDAATLARDFAAADLIGTSGPGSDDVSRILPADLKAFHKTWYTPRSMGIVVTGDVTFDEAMEAARRAFGSWDAPAPPTSSTPAPSPPQYTRVIVIDRPQAVDAAVVVAAPGAPVADAAWPSLWLVRELIAQGTPAERCPESASDLVSARASGGRRPPRLLLPAPDRQGLLHRRRRTRTRPRHLEDRAL